MSRRDLNLELYKKVYLIRAAEEKIREHYPKDQLKTPIHLSIGEEAIMAGVCQALDSKDQVFGTYRSHGLYLCRTGETDKFFAELYGKETGISKGKTGSMHLHAIVSGFLGSSAVVGTTIPVAVGAAYANKILKKERMVAVFFGDGAVEEGGFWESLNIACLKKCPVLFVCEDNDLAIHSRKKERQSFRSILDIVSQFPCHIFETETTDPEVVYSLASHALDKAKTTGQPSFLHLKYYRYLEHVGIHHDFKFGYRAKEEYKTWKDRDPVELQRHKVLTLGASKDEIHAVEKSIDRQIEESIRRAEEAAFPPNNELFQDVYA